MTDRLLTHGYFLWEDDKEREIMKPYAPLGLLYISAYLKRAGFDVETRDHERAAIVDRSTLTRRRQRLRILLRPCTVGSNATSPWLCLVEHSERSCSEEMPSVSRM